MKLNVSNIQHFSTGDGPGIRTTVFLKGCNLHCPWCHNPETISSAPVTMKYKFASKAQIFGTMKTVDEVADEVLQDKVFYDESGGGVTISGGEALLQPTGVALLSKKLKENGLHVILDTAGSVTFSSFEESIDFIDTYYLDIKSGDEVKLKKETGGNLSLILTNLAQLVKLGKEVRIRIPVIPGFNSSENEIKKIADILSPYRNLDVGFLPFHKMGVGKYEAMGLEYKYKNTPAPTDEDITKIKEMFIKK